MKIVILSRNSQLYSTSRLKEAGEKRGHQMQVVDYLRCYMDITAHKPTLLYQGKRLTGVDAVIPRVGWSQSFYGEAVVRQFEMMKVFTANQSLPLTRTRDKLRSLQLLSRKGIDMPVTGFAHSTKDIEGLIGIVGGPPLTIRLLEGTHGLGVILAETTKAAQAVIEAFRGLNANILVQEYLQEEGGADIRCLVIDGKVVAAISYADRDTESTSMQRTGEAQTIKLRPNERKAAVQAAKVMGLKICGVDLFRSQRGPLVMDVNSSPGLETIETTTGIDVADKVIEFVERGSRPGQTTDS